MNALRRILALLGKGNRKVAAIFAVTADAAGEAVRHVRAGADLPIWLFCQEEVSPGDRASCERVFTGCCLPWRAHRALWPCWVALGVGDWNGRPGNWLLKLTPLIIPPFRALIRNESGDFFAASPATVALHARRRAREVLRAAWVRLGEWTRGGALFAFAFVAQWYSPLSRWAFRRIRPSRTLSVSVTPAGSGIVHFSYREREWRRADLLELLSTTPARWILFERSGSRWPDPADLEAPFSDPATFVVSRQTGVRNWRKLLFATAPFRRLQTGEITEVFAPVSGQMLVDAAKLRALELPAGTSFGANWYLLFWQAAAGGWKSWSAASPEPSGELPAVPFDEAAFVRTLLDTPGLRTLAPRNPLLREGNIARQSTGGDPFRGFPRVLIASPYLPFPLSHGGAVRMYNLCLELAPRVDFILAVFREHADIVHYAPLHEIFREVYIVDIDRKSRNPNLPAQVNHYTSASMGALIAHLAREKAIDILQIEYTQMAGYRECAPATPAILVEHDLTFSLYRQLAARNPARAAVREYHRWLRFERDRLRAFGAVWTMSSQDRQSAIAEGAPHDRTFVVPNGVDLVRFSTSPEISSTIEILYVGSFRHRPNFLGFEELRRTIMPAVWQLYPEARLRVVAGPDLDKHWPEPRHADRRITVHAFVEDLLPLYQEATLVVVPLPISAGTNIKLMEALSCRRAVVTTPVGCAGLDLVDGEDALIRELDASFPAAICSLLADPAARERIAATGRQTAEARFGWNAIAEAAWQSYRAIAAARSSATR